MSSNNDRSPAADPGQSAEPEKTPVPQQHRSTPDGYDQYWIDDFQSDHRAAIRPYVRTGGRSRPSHDLRLETLVSAAWPGHPPLVAMARHTHDGEVIRDMCRTAPLSVAEVSAHLSVALGVARVLISDAIDAGLLVMHEPVPMVGDRPPLELMVRVHHGLRKLG